MSISKVVVVVVIVALVLAAVWGCGKKEEAKTGEQPAARGAGGPGGQAEVPPMPRQATGRGGMAGGPAGTGVAQPAAPTGPAVTVEEMIDQAMDDKDAGRLEHAEAKFRAAVAQEEDNEDAQWGLAWTLVLAGKNAEAIEEFNKVIEMTDDAARISEANATIDRLQ